MVPALAAALAVSAVLDWVAVYRDARRVEVVVKPLVMLCLGALAVALGAADTGVGRWLLVAVAFALVGDVLLLGRSLTAFLGGLVAFLLGHLAYVVAFLMLPSHSVWAVVGAALALAMMVTAGRRIHAGATREGGQALGGAVATYMVVIAAMVTAAWSTGRPAVMLGAVVFLVSDTVLALDRFVGPRAQARLVVMVTYHVGQVLMVLGALR